VNYSGAAALISRGWRVPEPHPVGAPDTVWCTPDSPVNYSAPALENSRRRRVRVEVLWCTGHCPVVHRMLGTFGVRRSSKTGFNSISAVQCVNRYPRTKVGIAIDRNNTKVDTEPKVRAGKLRRDSKEWNRLKDEKAIQTSIDYYRVIIKCKGHECNFVRAVSRVYK
jgi:hypothetical protein